MTQSDFTISLNGNSENHSISDIFTPEGNLNGNSFNASYLNGSKFINGVTITMNKNCAITLNTLNDLFLVVSTGVTFDGNGKTITIEGNRNNFRGLISCYGGNVKNLNVVVGGNVSLGGENNYYGGWICRDSAYGTINYCSSSDPIGDKCGGICGSGAGSLGTCSINNCFSTGTIGSNGGGICGNSASCTINNCFSSGEINGGGICGQNATSTINNCFSIGTIINGGGICGQNADCVINNCYSTGTITSGGGISGVGTSGTITNCYSNGPICGSNIGCTITNSTVLSVLPAGLDSNIWVSTSTYPKLKIFTELPWYGYDNYNSQINFFYVDFSLVNNNGVLTTFQGASSYLWDDNSTNYTRVVTTSGTYSVNITFENFTTSKSITINELSLSITSVIGDGTITLTADPIGGIGNYTYLWNNSSTTKSITVSPGNYSVTVNSGTETKTVNYNALSATITNNNGQLTVNATGGSGSYTYQWDNGEIVQTITPVLLGRRSIIVTSGSQSITCFSDSTNDDIILTNDNNGNLSVTLGNYAYNWTKNSDTTSLSSTNMLQINTSGTYYVTVSSNGDSITKSIIIDEIPITILNNYGTLSTNLSGNYTYLWNNNSTEASINITAAGTYSVKVFSTNSIGSASIVINSLNVSISYVTTGTLTANVSGSGSYQFSWSGEAVGSNQTLMPIRGGIYEVAVYDSLNGFGKKSVLISTTPSPTISRVGNTLVSSTTENFLSVLWNTGETTATINIDSNISSYYVTYYYSTVYSSNDQFVGKVGYREFNILTNLPIDITYGNGTLTANFSGGNTGAYYFYNWGNETAQSTTSTSITKNITTPGTYSLSVTSEKTINNSTETITGEKSITVPDLNASLTNDGEGLLTVSPGYSYKWDDNTTNNSVQITQAKTYNVIVYSSEGISNLSKTINSLTVSITNNNGTLTVSPPGRKYKWSDQTIISQINTRAITIDGNYSVIVYGDDSFGTANFDVAPLSLSIANDLNGILTASASGGSGFYTYSPGKTINITSSGTYSFTVNDSVTDPPDTVNDSVTKTFVVLDISNNITITNNLDGTLTTGPSNYNFKWNQSNGVVTSSGSYTVTAYSSDGYGTKTLTINEIPNVTLTFQQDEIIAPSGYNYKWGNEISNSNKKTITTSGTYSVNLYSGNGFGSASLVISPFSSNPTITFNQNILTVNTPGETGTYYVWTDGVKSSSNTRTITSGGTYSVMVYSSSKISNQVSLMVNAEIQFNIIIENRNLKIVPVVSGDYTYKWNGDDGDTIEARLGSFTAEVFGTNSSGSKTINVTSMNVSISSMNNTLSVLSTNNGECFWDDNSTNNTRTIDHIGTYSVTCYSYSGNTYQIGTASVNVLEMPVLIVSLRGYLTPVFTEGVSNFVKWSGIIDYPNSDELYYFPYLKNSISPRNKIGTFNLSVVSKSSGGILYYGTSSITLNQLTATMKLEISIDNNGRPIHIIKVNALGGNGSYNYSWSDLSSTGDSLTLTSLYGSSPKSYSVTVSSVNQFVTVNFNYTFRIDRYLGEPSTLIITPLPVNATTNQTGAIPWLDNFIATSWIGRQLEANQKRKSSEPKSTTSAIPWDVDFKGSVRNYAKKSANSTQSLFDKFISRIE